MGMMSKLAKLALAKKAFDYARKPENQAKIKGALASVRGKSRPR